MTPSIEITRVEQSKVKVTAILPVWTKPRNGFLIVKIPVLGIETQSKDDYDVETAVTEALHCYLQAAEKSGEGIEKELNYFGWSTDSEDIYILEKESDTIFTELLGTGYAQPVQLCM